MYETSSLTLADHALVTAAVQASGAPVQAPILEEGTFDVLEFRSELEHAEDNTQVGMQMLFEHQGVRMWRVYLEPGERVPFHCHKNPYTWICTHGSRGTHRENDGTRLVFGWEAGQMEYLPIRPGEKLIHDLENSGDTPLGFILVEALSPAT